MLYKYLVKNEILKTFILKFQIKKNNLKFKIFIIISLFLIIIIFSKKISKYINSREFALYKGRKYLNICLKGLLINHNQFKFKLINHYKISIIIPMHNSHKTIKFALRSIQNQNMIEIEIIVINDFSLDNSVSIIKQIIEKDKRIKLINNNKNKGILYSRCIGVLSSKGKYILNLDQDDMFFDNNLFNILYKKAEIGNYDIVSFMEVQGNNYYINYKDMKDGICTYHPDSLIIKQPHLSIYPFFKNEKFFLNDIQIWGKLFKSNIYKNAINLMGKERYNVFNIINEDQVALFAICSISKIYIFIRKYGLFHLVNNLTTSHKVSKRHKFEMKLFFSNLIFDLSKNEYKKYAVIIILLGKQLYLSHLLKIKNLKKYLIKILKKFINCKYIDNKYKEKIKKKYKNYHLLDNKIKITFI